MRDVDTSQPIDTYDGPGAKDAAERAATEMGDFARRYMCDLEARKVKEDHYRHGGQVRTRSVWGVFLVPWEVGESPGKGGAQSAPERPSGRRRTSS